jgi:uncharacterized membrane protein YbhN (UPF0104 family)
MDEPRPAQEQDLNNEKRLGLLKMLPGLAISVGFIWWTYIHKGPTGHRGLEASAFAGLHFTAPIWIGAVVLCTLLGYTMRCVRAWWMLRSVKASFGACSRVLMTSLAANNILPLRIGDVMRIFTYAGDLNATPSMILSTVLLEKLLDVFSLAALFVLTMHFGGAVSAHTRVVAEVGLAISTVGLCVLVFGARTLRGPLEAICARTENKIVKKIEHWLVLAMDCIRSIGVGGSLLLIVYSAIAWGMEGLLYISAARMIGLQTDNVGPWQAVAQANLSFLIPSSPGGIGPFEWACKDALVRHGASAAHAGLFGLMIHLWLLVALTATGGAMFLAHRLHRARRVPLVEELELLPVELP